MKLSVQIKQIAAFVSISFIITVSLSTISYIESRISLTKEVESRLQAEADKLANGYESWINAQFLELSAIARYMPFDDSPEMIKMLADASERLGFNSMGPADLNWNPPSCQRCQSRSFSTGLYAESIETESSCPFRSGVQCS